MGKYVKKLYSTVSSPENNSFRKAAASRPVRAVLSTISPFVDVILYHARKIKWRHHRDDRVFDWNWKAKKYNRIALVNQVLSEYSNPSYLEIGCASDALFASLPIIDKTGVDPLTGGTIRLTSDRFFETNQRKYDVIFIDGLHTYHQVKKDVKNALKFVKQGGCILLHDMLPSSWIEHHVPIISLGAWTGDVWKIAFDLLNTSGIDFGIVAIDHGVGIMIVHEENATLGTSNEDMESRSFSFFADNIGTLPICEWSDIMTASGMRRDLRRVMQESGKDSAAAPVQEP